MLEKVYKKVSLDLGIGEREVKRAYLSMWKFIREKIVNTDTSSKEAFESQRTSFNVPRLGKMYGSWKEAKRKKNV